MGNLQSNVNSVLGTATKIEKLYKPLGEINKKVNPPTEQEIQQAEEFEAQIEADKAKQMQHLGVVINDPAESGKFMSDWSDHGMHIGGFGEGAISKEDAQKILHELSWGKPNPKLSQSVDFDRAQTAQGIAHYQSKMASANKIAQKKKLMELKERAAGGKR